MLQEATKLLIGACIMISAVMACFFGNRSAVAATTSPQPQYATVVTCGEGAAPLRPQPQYELAVAVQRLVNPLAQPVVKVAAMATTAVMTLVMLRGSAEKLGAPPSAEQLAAAAAAAADQLEPPMPEATTDATIAAVAPAAVATYAHEPIDEKNAAAPLVFAMGVTAAAWDAVRPFGTFVVQDVVPAAGTAITEGAPALIAASAASAVAERAAAESAAAAAAAAAAAPALSRAAVHQQEVEELLATAAAATATAERAAADANAAVAAASKRRAQALEAAASARMKIRGIGGQAAIKPLRHLWAADRESTAQELDAVTFSFTGEEPASSQLLAQLRASAEPQPPTPDPTPEEDPELTPPTPAPPAAVAATPEPHLEAISTPQTASLSRGAGVVVASISTVNFLTTQEEEGVAVEAAPAMGQQEQEQEVEFNMGWTRYISQLLVAEDRGSEYKNYELVGELLEVAARSEEIQQPKYDPLRPVLQRADAEASRREQEGSEAARWRLVKGLVEGVPRRAQPQQFDLVYDLLRSLRNAGDPDLILLSTHPKYDPVWAVLSSAAPTTHLAKNDMVSSLLKFALSSPAPSKYDPMQGLLKSRSRQPGNKYDLVAGLHSMASGPAPADSKYCPVNDLLHGSWQDELSLGLEHLPDWDPLRLLVQAARSETIFSPNKYDMVADLLAIDSAAPSEPSGFDFVGSLLRALKQAPADLANLPRWDFMGGLRAALQSGPSSLPDPFGSLVALLKRAPESLPDPFSSLMSTLKAVAAQLRGDMDEKYDPVADILRLEALGGSAKFDPLAVMHRRAGPAFQAVTDSFRGLMSDPELREKHSGAFAIMQRAAEVAAAPSRERPAKFCPVWSVLYGKDRSTLLDVVDSVKAANREFQRMMTSLQRGYDPVYSLVAGRDSEAVASVMCTMYKWLEGGADGGVDRWDATTAAAEQVRAAKAAEAQAAETARRQLVAAEKREGSEKSEKSEVVVRVEEKELVSVGV